jgi:hypothetical protein
MSFLGGSIPASSSLSNQLQPTTGATFSSEGGAAYVAVANLEIGSPTTHAPSKPNGIGGATLAGSISYSTPIVVTFSNPADSLQTAVTNFVSIQGDLRPIAGSIHLIAYDLLGSQIASDTEPDSVGTLLSVTAASIHSVKFYSDSGTVAFDNLTFNQVSSVPEPAPLILALPGLMTVLVARRSSVRSANRRQIAPHG